MAKFLFNVEFNLQDGAQISGPVTTEDETEFLFHDTHGQSGLFFKIQLVDGTWKFIEGSEGLSVLDEIVETVGMQVEAYYLGKSPDLE